MSLPCAAALGMNTRAARAESLFERAVREAHTARLPHARSALPILVQGRSAGASSATRLEQRIVSQLVSKDGPAAVRVGARDLASLRARRPEWRIALDPPLRPLMDRAIHRSRIDSYREHSGRGGKGVVIGVVDTGIDARHPDFTDAEGHTRIAWLMDMSQPALGLHPELEAQFGCTDETAPCAVMSASDIDAALAGRGPGFVPQDSIGHGTHVASLAAGDGRHYGSTYVGAAPEARLIVVRATRSADGSMADPDVLSGVRFVFDRARSGLPAPAPAVVNLSLGREFGPHDGSTLLEQSLAELAASDHPGRAIVVAAGDGATPSQSGPFRHARMRLASQSQTLTLAPESATGSGTSGSAFVWLAFKDAENVRIAMHGPRGLELAATPLGGTQRATDRSSTLEAELGPPADGFVERPQSGAAAATLVLSGSWKPTDAFTLEVSGAGRMDAWLQNESVGPGLAFQQGTAEGNIMIPASHGGLLAVGCTVNRVDWVNQAGMAVHVNGVVEDSACWFSATGPNLLGAFKPELSAPGQFVVGAMSRDATPDHRTSMFAFGGGACAERDCAVVDTQHAIASGTSMSAALVSGAAALLLEQQPTLTQRELTLRLQASARRPTGPLAPNNQIGVGALALSPDEGSSTGSDDRRVAPDMSWVSLSSEELERSENASTTGFVLLRDASLFPVLRGDADTLSIRLGDRVLKPALEIAPGLSTFAVSADGLAPGTEVLLDVRWDDDPLGTVPFSGSRKLRVEPEATTPPKMSLSGGCSLSGSARDGICFGPYMLLIAIFSWLRSWPARSRRAAFAACGSLTLATSGCGLMATPRPEDNAAPSEYYNKLKSPERTQSSCSPPVELLRSTSEALRPYDELATLSASCYPGTPSLCEDRLTQRACELKADAVILMQPTAGGTPPGSSTQSQISMSGRAVRWRPN